MSAEPVLAYGVSPDASAGRVLLEDRCARCGRLVLAHDLAWRLMASAVGLVTCANWCSRTCQDRAIPEAVVRLLRERRRAEDEE